MNCTVERIVEQLKRSVAVFSQSLGLPWKKSLLKTAHIRWQKRNNFLNINVSTSIKIAKR